MTFAGLLCPNEACAAKSCPVDFLYKSVCSWKKRWLFQRGKRTLVTISLTPDSLKRIDSALTTGLLMR